MSKTRLAFPIGADLLIARVANADVRVFAGLRCDLIACGPWPSWPTAPAAEVSSS